MNATLRIGAALFAILSAVIITHTATPTSFADKNETGQVVIQQSIPTKFQGVTRTYYIAADEVKWNYAPTGINGITGIPLADDNKTALYTINGKDRIGSIYLKCIYQGYTDDTFTARQNRTAQWQHLGILGPVIHAEVGDTIKVVFKNNCRMPTSMHPHGVFYDKSSEGAPYNDGIPGSEKPGDSVPPGKTFTYTWSVPERAGPGPGDPSSMLWMYHSHVDEAGDTYAGLVGPILITRHGEANPDGTPTGVDREFVTLYSIFDENRSPYLDYNIDTFAQDPSSVHKDDPDFEESNKKHSINGYIFGNLPGLVMKQYTHVRWYVAGMGTEDDLHTPHWHGNTLLMNNARTDTVEILPMSMKVLDMYPDDPGTWLYHCHVNDHIQAGMQALYTVEKNTNRTSPEGSSGAPNIELLTDPANPIAGQPVRLAISFLDAKTNAFEKHVDYKITVTRGSARVFGTSSLHADEGFVTMPYQFRASGTYNVTVEVDGIYFIPTSYVAQFSINVTR